MGPIRTQRRFAPLFCGLIIAALVGCRDSKPKAQPEEPEVQEKPKSECERRSERLARGLVVDPTGGATSFAPLRLPRTKRGQAITHPSVRVSVDASGSLRVDDNPIDSPGDGALKRALAQARKLFAEKSDHDPSIVLLIADAKTKTSELEKLFAALPKDAKVRIVANADGPMDRLLEQELISQAEMEWLDSVYSDTKKAELEWVRNIGTECNEDIRFAVSHFATAEPGDRMNVLAREIPAAMLKCQCAGLGDHFEVVMFASMLGQGRPARWFPLSRTDLGGTSTVADLVPR